MTPGPSVPTEAPAQPETAPPPPRSERTPRRRRRGNLPDITLLDKDDPDALGQLWLDLCGCGPRARATE